MLPASELGDAISQGLKLIAWLLVLTITSVFIKAFYNVYFHPLSKFPGPKSFAASRIPSAMATITGRMSYAVKDLHDRYGEVVRTAPNILAFSSATASKEIYMRQPNRPAMVKPRAWYMTPPGGVDSILTAVDPHEHSRHRRLLSHAFSDKALREQEPLIKNYVDLLMARLHQNTEQGAQDMISWFNFTAFDIIGDLTMGESFGCLQDSKYHPWVSFLFKHFKYSAFLTEARAFPPLSTILSWLIPKELVQSRMKHTAFTRAKIEKRMEMGTARHDFMSNVLSHMDKETGITKDEIVATFGILLIAGSETTATLLAAATFYLCKNQEVMKKLVEEIRTSFETEDDITMISVNKLRYLLAVLDEALRIHPPTPQGPPRVVPSKGEYINGHFVSGGTIVFVATYSTDHQAANWRDPDSFVPERWLDDPRYRSDNRASFTPFSLGPQNCIGMNLAYAEMRLILARLLWNFDLELDERSRRWANNMKMFILWEKPSLFVKLNPVERFKG